MADGWKWWRLLLLGPAIVAVACGISCFAPPARGAAPAVLTDQIEAHLAAGEFGPALQLARGATPVERDEALALIATAQVAAGARGAFYNTAAEIADDRVRARALRGRFETPLGQGLGGGAQADFDALMGLITATVAPDTWQDNGGEGGMMPFRNGVYVDAAAVMRRAVRDDASGALDELRRAARHQRVSEEVRRASPLRKVSLARLEREVQLRVAAGRPLDEDMLVLAGLRRVRYVLVYPESHDVVLAGPAGDWKLNHESRAVSVDDGQPLPRLDDLVVLLRQQDSDAAGHFGCSIVPTAEGLARAKAFAESTQGTALKPSQRGAWLKELRDQLGRQAVVFDGIDPASGVAQVMLEADHHMKLIGIGLEPGTLRVPSYLSMIHVGRGESPPPLDVLRWWFTLDYEAVLTSADRNAFELRGQGVKVLSENELLTATGQRVHTGQSDALNREFAADFTRDFAALAEKYPVYGELRNIFDLALVAALVRSEGLAARVGWHLSGFRDPEQYCTSTEPVPHWVESVVNHRVINRVHVVAAVSGGVRVDARGFLRSRPIQNDGRGNLDSERQRSAPRDVAPRAWWWD